VTRRHNVRWKGSGRHVVVLAHGFGCDQHVWHRLSPHLEDQCRIVAFDHVGSGRSDMSAYTFERYRRLDGYADDLARLLRAFEFERCTVVGHSVGAMIAMRAAIAAPEAIGRLVMLAPSPRYIDDPATGYVGGFQPEQITELLEMMEASSGQWTRHLAGLVIDEEHAAERIEMERLFCATSPKVARDFAEATFRSDCRPLLGRCAAPSLIVGCTGDRIAPDDVTRYVARALPSASHVQLATRGHCPHITAPRETAEAILAFIGRSPVHHACHRPPLLTHAGRGR
jgi:sigma-B regulation protein RsbQ